jgi:hypothetical protein
MSDFTFTKEKHIKYIIKGFDFEKVHEVMKLLNWTWWHLDHIPSVEDLIKEATKLLNELYDSEYSYIETGGFKVSKSEDHMSLEFIITDYSSEMLNYGNKYEKLKGLKIRRKKLNTIDNLQKLEEYEND